MAVSLARSMARRSGQPASPRSSRPTRRRTRSRRRPASRDRKVPQDPSSTGGPQGTVQDNSQLTQALIDALIRVRSRRSALHTHLHSPCASTLTCALGAQSCPPFPSAPDLPCATRCPNAITLARTDASAMQARDATGTTLSATLRLSRRQLRVSRSHCPR